MKAVIQSGYGSPQLIASGDTQQPNPSDNEVLIRVACGSLNAKDRIALSGSPFLIRAQFGLFKPTNPVPGSDIAGIIEAVGSGVSTFKIGDRVFGELESGAFGTFAVAPIDRLAKIPDSVSMHNAGSLPIAGLTGLQGLRDYGGLKPGMRVLVNGASGGVGMFATQIAVSGGAVVSTVSSEKNREFCTQNGSTTTYAYDNPNMNLPQHEFDLVFDAVGNLSGSRMRQLLADNGTGVIAGFESFSRLLSLMLQSKPKKRNRYTRLVIFTAKPNETDLQTLADMVSVGRISPRITHIYNIEKARQAFEQISSKRTVGKVLLSINPDIT